MHPASYQTFEFCNQNQYCCVEGFFTVYIQEATISFSTSMLFLICLLKYSACRNFHSRRLVSQVVCFMKQFLLQKSITTFTLQSFVLEIMLCCILMLLENFCIQSIRFFKYCSLLDAFVNNIIFL